MLHFLPQTRLWRQPHVWRSYNTSPQSGVKGGGGSVFFFSPVTNITAVCYSPILSWETNSCSHLSCIHTVILSQEVSTRCTIKSSGGIPTTGCHGNNLTVLAAKMKHPGGWFGVREENSSVYICIISHKIKEKHCALSPLHQVSHLHQVQLFSTLLHRWCRQA